MRIDRGAIISMRPRLRRGMLAPTSDDRDGLGVYDGVPFVFSHFWCGYLGAVCAEVNVRSGAVQRLLLGEDVHSLDGEIR